MCFTYRILESMDSDIYLSMFSPELEKATSRPDVQFPSVLITSMQSEPSDIMDAFEDFNSYSSDDEFFDALTGDDLESSTTEDVEDLRPISVDWTQDVWPQEDWTQQDCSQENSSQEITDSQTDGIDTSEDNDHPFAGWHSHRLVNSDWVNHSYIDKTDHIDTWARRSASSSLARCNWVAYPEDGGWPKPENDHVWGAPEAPELRLVTPEGDVWWLDDPVDYEALPWEREVAEERNRILASIW